MISKLGCKTKGLHNIKGQISSFGSKDSLSWDKPSIIPDNEIWYTSTDGIAVTPSGFQNIKSNQYSHNKGIIKFSISITEIPDFAFYNCSTLKSIILPSNIGSIGIGAFLDCINLGYIKIPEKTSQIKGGAFCGCSKLSKIQFLSFLAPKLKSTNIVDGDTLENGAIFKQYTTQLDSEIQIAAKSRTIYAIYYPDWENGNITFYWSSAQATCPFFIADTRDVPNANTGRVFYTGTIPKRGTFTVPQATVESWAPYADPDGYLYIRFYSQAKAKITMYGEESNVANQMTSVFKNTNSYKVLSLPSVSSGYEEDEWNDFSTIEINKYDCGKIDNDSVWIYNNGILTLNCKNNIPNYIETSSIPYKGYASNVVIEGDIQRIGDYAFYNCDSIKSLKLPNSITYIGNYTFYNCDGLLSLSVPPRISSIGTEAFKNIPNIFYFGNKTIYSDYGHKLLNGFIETPFVYTNKNKTDLVRCWKHTSGSISVQNGVTTITDGAFYDCFNITSITIPNSVTQIGTDVFKGCTNLPIRNGMKYAGTCLVETTDKTLSTYNVESGTRFICNNAFENINEDQTSKYNDSVTFTNIIIPNSVEKIGNHAFLYSTGISLTLNRFYNSKLIEIVEDPNNDRGTFYIYNIIFNINEFDSNFNLNNILDHGSGQKLAATYNIYTDLEQIAILAKNFNDEYTLVTPYYLNGTKWYPDPEPETEQES